jgi:hypothetical protein
MALYRCSKVYYYIYGSFVVAEGSFCDRQGWSWLPAEANMLKYHLVCEHDPSRCSLMFSLVFTPHLVVEAEARAWEWTSHYVNIGYWRCPMTSVQRAVKYTDGSRMSDGSGTAMRKVRLMRMLSFSLGVHATVFQTEVLAVLACVKEYIERNCIGECTHIYDCSDCQGLYRKHCKLVTGLLTGCCSLMWHLHFMALSNHTSCRKSVGQEEESSCHTPNILCQCPGLARHKMRILALHG